MHIVYCIAGTWNSGGMERVLADKTSALVAAGYKVSIVTTDQRGQKPFFPLDESIRCYDLGINYDANNGKSILDKLIRYPVKRLRHHYRLARLLKELKADVVMSMFNNDAGFIPMIKDGSRKMLEIHFSRFKRQQYGRKGLWLIVDGVRSIFDLRKVRRYERFVVLTEEDKKYWGDLPNIRVINNPRPFTCDKPAALDNHTVIAVGRYSYQKGYDRLLRAWKLAVTDDWKLKILGEGELRGEMESLVEELGIADSVILGRATNRIIEEYQSSSLLVMSSRYEGLPMVLLEAQAAGLPIVSFACKCGPRDVITDGTDGFLVEDGNIEELAKKIRILLQNDKLRKEMGAAAFESSARYTKDNIMNQWKDLFEGRL